MYQKGDKVHNRSSGKDGVLVYPLGWGNWEVKIETGQLEEWNEHLMRLVPKPSKDFVDRGSMYLHFCDKCGCHYSDWCPTHDQ